MFKPIMKIATGAAFGLVLHSLAQLALAVLIGTPSLAAAQVPAIGGVTYGQPKVTPGEYNGDLSRSPMAPTTVGKPKIYRPRLQGPPSTKVSTASPALPSAPQTLGGPLGPMPSPIKNFAGLSFNDNCGGVTCGAGWPPDTNGDVGPNHYIEAVNDAIAIYNKTGTLLAKFNEDQLYIGTPAEEQCNGNSQGDPVVIYDWLADRFVLTWFAFVYDFFEGPVSPFYQCIAASKTSDPVTGGWWLYPVRMDPGGPGLPPAGDMNDYGRFGLWHDCLYMGANAFVSFFGNYDGVSFASFSRADLYSGAALTYSLGWLPPDSNAFTLIPSNNQGTGSNAAQPGTPNYFVSESGTIFAFEVRTFTSGPNCGGGGTLSAPTNVSQAAYTFQQGAVVPQPNTTSSLDMIDDRIMQKVQYRKIGGAESLWVTHPVGAATGLIAMQWAQLDVTGGTIATTPVQQQIYTPDASLHRFMGSLAVDGQGNMALGYTTSNGNAPNFPSIAYSGRLVTDPLNTLQQTEVQMIAGAGSQTNSCGGGACDRWGDYSAMSLDPADTCTFWYVNEYYSSQTNGSNGNWQTRIGSFQFPSCLGLTSSTTTLSSSANPSIVGTSVTFTATVSGAAPTGNVNFTDGGVSLSGCSAVALSGSGNNPAAQCTASSLTLGTHSIVASYGGDPNNTASTSANLSQVVSSMPSASLVNPSFETPALGNGYQYNPSGAGIGWTFSTNSGIQGNGSAWGAAPAPAGTQTAFIQTASSISQTLNLNAGSYTLSFMAAQRACCASPFVQPIKVTVDGTQIGSVVSPASTNFTSFSIPFSVASSGAHTLTFAGTDPNDRTTFIDNITLIPSGGSMTSLASSLNPSRVGKSVTFTATVIGTSPTGTVAFTSNGNPITGCTAVALTGAGNSRIAKCLTSFATRVTSTYSIAATYGGDASNTSSISAPLSELVKARR